MLTRKVNSHLALMEDKRLLKKESFLSTEIPVEAPLKFSDPLNSKSTILNQSMPVQQEFSNSQMVARAELVKNTSFQDFKKVKISNGVIISSHMIENYNGVLPGQKVFQWDRLDEYKMNAKKAKNEISEIKADQNESVLSHESYSLINKSIFNDSRNGPRAVNHSENLLGSFQNFEINELKNSAQFEREDLETMKGQINLRMANFKKKPSMPEIMTPRERILERESPSENRQLEPFRQGKLAQENDR